MRMVEGLEQARAAVMAGETLLISPPGAALFHGIGWWKALDRALREEFPARPLVLVLDCGPAPGLALAALRVGLRDVRVTAPDGLREGLAAAGLRLH